VRGGSSFETVDNLLEKISQTISAGESYFVDALECEDNEEANPKSLEPPRPKKSTQKSILD
jgi:hypothetical protein